LKFIVFVMAMIAASLIEAIRRRFYVKNAYRPDADT
jgi:hypothetical protein